MLGAVGYLFHKQAEFQDCLATYTAQDAAARDIRSQSSANTINALVEQSEALTKALDPANQPASDEDVAAAIAAIAAVPFAQSKYNGDIERNPYPKYTCGGAKPKELVK